jgi:hypothetical protein
LNEKSRSPTEKARLRDALTDEFNWSLDSRIQRHLDLRPHQIVANSHFAAVSTECHSLYRDGHYYGTIALAQAVTEALVKFMCVANRWRPGSNFETNVNKLRTRGVITNELQALLTSVWRERDDYHHLNSGILQDQRKLEALAKEKLSGLKALEEDLFAYTLEQGKLVPKYRKYWPESDELDGAVSAYLRFD